MTELQHLKLSGRYSRPPRDRVLHADKLLSDLRESTSEAQRRGLDPTDPNPLTFELRREAEEGVDLILHAADRRNPLSAANLGQSLASKLVRRDQDETPPSDPCDHEWPISIQARLSPKSIRAPSQPG